MRQWKILLADDHAVVREGLQSLLAGEFDIVGATANGRALIAAVRRVNPDLVIADISMPLLNGIEAARQIRKERPRTKVLILTMHVDVTYATEVLAAGASGYALKNAPSDELLRAVRQVLNGRTYVAPEIEQDVMPFLMEGAHQTNRKVGRLTPRQREVIQLLAEGHTNREIAAILSVSPRTVEFHKYKMMQDLGLHSTAELTRYAVKHGVVSN